MEVVPVVDSIFVAFASDLKDFKLPTLETPPSSAGKASFSALSMARLSWRLFQGLPGPHKHVARWHGAQKATVDPLGVQAGLMSGTTS